MHTVEKIESKMFRLTPKMYVSVINRRNSRFKLKSPHPTPQSMQNNRNSALHENTYYQSFRLYLLNTTLHGLKYVGDSTIALFGR